MKSIAEIFCLMFSFGIVSALIPIRRLDLLTSFFRTNSLVSFALFLLFAWLHPQQSYASYWPGALLLVYSVSVFWLPPLIGKCVLLTIFFGMLRLLNFSFNSSNIITYEYFLEFTSIVIGGALVGFSLVAMNVGHSYLSTVKLPMRPLRVTTLWIGAFIVLRLLGYIFGVFQVGTGELGQYFSQLGVGNFPILAIAMARTLFGLVGPAILVVMVWKTVEIESTQSATGILYALLSMTIIGEGCSLFLNLQTMVWF